MTALASVPVLKKRSIDVLTDRCCVAILYGIFFIVLSELGLVKAYDSWRVQFGWDNGYVPGWFMPLPFAAFFSHLASPQEFHFLLSLSNSAQENLSLLFFQDSSEVDLKRQFFHLHFDFVCNTLGDWTSPRWSISACLPGNLASKMSLAFDSFP